MAEAHERYQVHYQVQFVDRLGDGKDGCVFETQEKHAVKFFNEQSIYRRELRAYQILRQRDIDEIDGFQVPRLIRSDDTLRNNDE